MGFNAFAMRLIFLALPGIVGSKVYKKLRGRTNRRRWEDFVEVFLFALASYAIVVIGTGLWQEVWRSEDAAQDGEAVLDAFLDEDLPLDWAAILKATVVSLLLGLAAAYNHTYSLSMRLARWMRLTRRTGDEDIWEVFFNTPDLGWCVVRDHEQNLMYFGFLRYYSDSEKDRELVLENVAVHANDTGKNLYTTHILYLSREPSKLTLEVPQVASAADSASGTE